MNGLLAFEFAKRSHEIEYIDLRCVRYMYTCFRPIFGPKSLQAQQSNHLKFPSDIHAYSRCASQIVVAALLAQSEHNIENNNKCAVIKCCRRELWKISAKNRIRKWKKKSIDLITGAVKSYIAWATATATFFVLCVLHHTFYSNAENKYQFSCKHKFIDTRTLKVEQQEFIEVECKFYFRHGGRKEKNPNSENQLPSTNTPPRVAVSSIALNIYFTNINLNQF